MSESDTRTDDQTSTHWWLRPDYQHLGIVLAFYPLAFGIAWQVFRFSEATSSAIAILATGSIFATFGSALMTLFGLLEKDSLERVRLDMDILHKDILKNSEPWRRWPFLPRRSQRSLHDGSSIRMKIRNPEIPFDVGSHTIQVALPSVYEDFFDLPVLSNWWKLKKFHRSFHTYQALVRKKKSPFESGGPTSSSDEQPQDEDPMIPFMLYNCMLDIWGAILRFRTARYGTHLGAAFTLSGIFVTVLKLA